MRLTIEFFPGVLGLLRRRILAFTPALCFSLAILGLISGSYGCGGGTPRADKTHGD